MKSRLVAAAAAVVLTTGSLALVGAGPAAAAKPKITASGNVHCVGGGKAKIKPAITNTAAAGNRTTTIKFKMDCTGTTGNPLVSVVSAKITATSTVSASGTCINLLGVSPAPWAVNIKWKASGGKILPTTVGYSNQEGTVEGFNLPSQSPPVGTSSVSGSWAGSGPSSLVAKIPPEFLTELGEACDGKGIKKIVFSPTSWIDI